jgi:hypothetical protein
LDQTSRSDLRVEVNHISKQISVQMLQWLKKKMMLELDLMAQANVGHARDSNNMNQRQRWSQTQARMPASSTENSMAQC